MLISVASTLRSAEILAAAACSIRTNCSPSCSSISEESSLATSSPCLTCVPSGMTHNSVLPPATLHLISTLRALSTLPSASRVLSTSPRRTRTISGASSRTLLRGHKNLADSVAATTSSASNPARHPQPGERLIRATLSDGALAAAWRSGASLWGAGSAPIGGPRTFGANLAGIGGLCRRAGLVGRGGCDEACRRVHRYILMLFQGQVNPFVCRAKSGTIEFFH